MKSALGIVGQERPSPAVSFNIRTAREAAPGKFLGRAAFVTLGCAKNQVDSEVMVGVLKQSGYEIVTDVAEADVAVVNTCGFLESALKESVDTILEVAELKKEGRLRKLIVAGCAVSRYGGQLKETLPEVDSFITTEDILKVGDVAGGVGEVLLDGARPYFLYDDTMPRVLSTAGHTAYVKIAEGCNRPCTFCIIPKIRGTMRSRPISSIVREIQQLSAQGVREVNLVAQDLTSYGTDIKGGNLAELLRSINDETDITWARLLYAYPIGTDEELLRTIVKSERMVNYLDLPLQHSSERVLKEMRRPLGRFAPRRMTDLIGQIAPEIHLRTTFIVGFPGESEADVADLESFIAEGHFTSVGVFMYSPEPGTPAHDMASQVPEKEKKARRDRLMAAQQLVSRRRLAALIEKELPVLVDGPHEESDLLWAGRTEFQAPEVDGHVIINDSLIDSINSGHFGRMRITESSDYDLIGTLIA